MDIATICLVVFAALTLEQLCFYLFIYLKLAKYKEKKNNFSKAVSVVVCGYNEEKHWEGLVEKLLEQDYPNFEIVLVNDQSTDNTKFVFKQWEYHPKIKLVDIREDIKKGLGKKFALTLGIKAAKYDYLLLTDADCYPRDNHWISSMVQHFSNKTIVLGYGAYERTKGLLNKLIRFDTFQVAMQYFSYALIGKTYMGVGRNLAYKKSLFFDNKGFASHLHLPSGDDDLFIKEVTNSNNTAISLGASAHTISEPKTTWKSWIRQKSRHLSTGVYYKPYHKVMLGLWTLSQALFWIFFITLLFLEPFIYITLSFFLIRLIIQLVVSFNILKRLNEKDLIYLYPFLELLFIFFYFIFIVNRLIKKKRFW
jgi:glycosyltransferase involved in cell wall biosynthesis